MLILAALLACQVEPVRELAPDAFDGPSAVDAPLAPPTVIHLDGPDAWADRFLPVRFRVSLLDPEETAYILMGPAEGEGPCRRITGGHCIGVVPPVVLAGTGVGDGEGEAVIEVDPARWIGAYACYQAVAMRGPSGIFTGMSDVICLEFCDDPDADEHCTPVDAFPDDPEEWSDLDGDGVGDNGDRCPHDPLDDRDGDGVCDSDDPCPDDRPDDTDGDGVCDTDDPCPLDIADDTDGDGVCDSDDACPLDVADDSDGDSVCDSDDACPDGDDSLDADDDGIPDACDFQGMYAAEGRRGSYGSDFFHVDPDSGEVTYISTLPFPVTGMSFDDAGTLWAIEGDAAGVKRIGTIDLDTGELTVVSTTDSDIRPSGFAWHEGTLYGWTEAGAGSDDFLIIDPYTGAVSVYSDSTGTGDNCMASLDGNLWMKSGATFYNFGPSPGAGTGVGYGSFGPSGRANGCTAHEGSFYVASGTFNLHRCDPFAFTCVDTGIYIDDGIDALASGTP